MNNFSDNNYLVSALKNGDEEAYLFLVNNFSKRLFAYALTLVNDHSFAQDILQNVYLKTWKHKKKLNPKFSIQSFLYKSVYNEFVNQYKHNEAMSKLETKYFQSLEKVVNKAESLDVSRAIQVVNEEINKLPPKCRQVFTLSKKEGLSNIEISEHLEISLKTVEGQITKAFKILREKLGDKIKPILFLLFDFRNKVGKLELR